MKTRVEIKAQARTNFITRYWPVVGIGALGMALINAMPFVPFVGWLLSLLVGIVISVGMVGYSLNVYRGNEVKVENLFSPFNRYGRVLGGILWMFLWLFIWGLIFIVPMIIFVLSMLVSSLGAIYNPVASTFAIFSNPLWYLLFLLLIPAVIKALSYFATPYILADSPNVPGMDALTLSKKMMVGYKWKLFVANLSFIGWFAIMIGVEVLVIFLLMYFAGFDQSIATIWATLAFYVPYVFFIGPYYEATMAGFYEEIKEQAKQKGIPGTEALR